MKKILWFILTALMACGNALALTVYEEDFSAPAKLGNSGATSELGNGGSYTLGTWVYSSGNGGVDDPPQGDGSGVDASNEIDTSGEARPQAGRGGNARAVSVILDKNLFENGTEYTVSFDVIGDASGGDAGRYWLALVSGTDTDDGILIDGTQGGWSSAKPFAASGSANATVNYVQDSASNGVLIDGENSAGTTPVSFTFTHDGVSDVAFAAGTYNNIFAIDNFAITADTGASPTNPYSEEFTSPSTVKNFQGQLGGNSLVSSTSYMLFNQWISAANGGINEPASGDGTGIGSGNDAESIGKARPQDIRGANGRAVALILAPALFSSIPAGTVLTVSFDVTGDTSGNSGESTRYFLSFVSGYDYGTGTGDASTDAAIVVDVSEGGWGSINLNDGAAVFSGKNGATATQIAEASIPGTTSATTSNFSFDFTYDGSSAVAFAAASFNNIFSIDNFQITGEIITQPAELKMYLITAP